MTQEQLILFKRSINIYNTETEAWTALDNLTHIQGQPVVAFFRRNSDTHGDTALGAIFAIGTANGVGKYKACSSHDDMLAVVQALNTHISEWTAFKATFDKMFEYDVNHDAIKAKLDFYTDSNKNISAGGLGGSGSSSLGALYQLVDVMINSTGDGVEGAVGGSVLAYDATAGKWKAIAQSEILPDMSGYYTKDETDAAINAIPIYSMSELSTSEIANLSDGANVREAYRLKKGGSNVDDTVIKIYKDSAIKSLELRDNKYLALTYTDNEGNEQSINIDLSAIVADKYVDLINNQDIGGIKTFTEKTIFKKDINVLGDAVVGGEVSGIVGEGTPVGVTNYAQLQGKPSINGKELASGDNTLDALGIQPKGDYTTASQLATTLADYATKVFISNNYATKAAVNVIQALIPATASADNQLADKDFVNSSIATATAEFRGSFTSLDELKATSGNLNDYAFYLHTDDVGNKVVDRYKWTTAGWLYEYTLNNSSFTAEQWAALNSAITATLVQSYNSHLNNSIIHITAAERTAWNNKWDYDEETIKGVKVNAAVSADYASSAGDADTLGGYHETGFYRASRNDIPSGDLATLEAGSYYAGNTAGDTNPLPSTYVSLSVLGKSYYSQQLCVTYNATRAWLRGIINSTTKTASDWHELAFTDSNVASATKLQDNTAFTAWGQTFFENGKPKNVSGDLTNVGNISASGKATIQGDIISGGEVVAIVGEGTPAGVTDYSALTGKPSINGVTIVSGNNTLAALGIQAAGDYATNSGVTTLLANYADKTFVSNNYVGKSAFNSHTADTNIHITSADRVTWNAKWDYNEATIKAIKVNSALSADSVAWTGISNKPTTIAGYGITDAYTATTIDSKLSGYLPLSGGTLDGNLNFNANLFITSAGNRVLDMYSGIDTYLHGSNVVYIVTPNLFLINGEQIHAILHSGNIGNYALKTDGRNEMSSSAFIKWNTGEGTENYSVYGDGFRMLTYNSSTGDYRGGISAGTRYGWQLVRDGFTDSLQARFRVVDTTTWDAWKTIAFTDSNVASATKLQTPRTIWGQSFDGTGNVDGGITIRRTWSTGLYNEGIRVVGTSEQWCGIFLGTQDSYSGYQDSQWNIVKTDIDTFRIMRGPSYLSFLEIKPNGNVLIGTTTDNGYKLQVNGTERVYGDLIVDGEVSALVA